MELGWLSPNGELIKADYMSHMIIADKICKQYYPNVDPVWSDEFLMKQGWVHITMTTFIEHAYHILWDYNVYLTQAQKNYLKPIVELNWAWISDSCKPDLIEELDIDWLDHLK